MNLDAVREIARKHLAESRAHLAQIASLEPTDIQAALPLAAKVLNGLYYVQLYSVIERTVNEVVQRTLSHISSAAIQSNHIQSSFCPITLFPDMMSIRGVKDQSLLVSATKLFAKQADTASITVTETCLAKFLQNIWMKTLDELCDAFGITKLRLDPRIRTTVDEVTENRNKVAHGRENASAVGERHRSHVLRDRTDHVEVLLFLLISEFENLCATKSFIKPFARKKYTF